MKFRALGPLELCADGPIELGGPRQRAVLAALLLRANRLATVAYLTDSVWEKSPAAPASNIRTYISDLRRRLWEPGEDAPRLAARQGGYILTVLHSEFDLALFEELVDQGDGKLLAGDVAAAAERLGRALGLWQGRPFEGLDVGIPLRAEIARLEDRRVFAAMRYTRAAGELGRHDEVVRVLRGLVMEYPLREELWAALMSTHLTAGYRAEALDTYQRVRARMVEELGVEPGPRLRRLHGLALTAGDGPALSQLG